VDKNKLQEIYQKNIKMIDDNFSQYATHNNRAYRLKAEDKDYTRTQFAIDRDRILYSGAYRRYQGKTQVFSFTNLFDEEMSNRSLHTIYVSQISRTIGKNLHLNTELIEAIALGHDLGHTPFGHDGEVALSKVCKQYGIGAFHHNIESMHIVDHISNRGKGLNLTFQVRDGIISHDGEVHNAKLIPKADKTEADIQNYIEKMKSGQKVSWMPATLEGCVVRISDTIAYIGQDIEDAIRYKILQRQDLPKDCVAHLGNTNSQIIDTLVKSVVLTSYNKDYIAFDEDTSNYLLKLKKFNYDNIYTNASVKESKRIINRSTEILFNQYMEDIETHNSNSKIFKHFLNKKTPEYCQKFSNAEKVRDFLATMTDRYFNEEVKHYLLPGRFL
jgi:dGTPase